MVFKPEPDMVRPKDTIWNYWTDAGKDNNGKVYSKCVYCNLRLQTNVTRFKLHIVMCQQTPDNVKLQFREAVLSQSIASTKQKAALVSTVEKVLDTASQDSLTPVSLSDKSNQLLSFETETSRNSNVECSEHFNLNKNSFSPARAYNNQNRALRNYFDSITNKEKVMLDSLFAKACYTNMWSFNSIKNPYFCEFIEKLRPSYKLPTVHTLSNHLLDETYNNVNAIIQKSTSDASALTLQLDGWSDINRASFINVALFTGRPIFLSSINPGAARHDAQFIANTVFQTIDSLGSNKAKVRAVITDQPTVMKAAWQRIEEQHPYITCYGCAAHVINLLSGDFRKMQTVETVLEKNRKISKFFKCHGLAGELLHIETQNKYGASLNVLLGCSTRWSTNYFMLRRNIRIKTALTATVVDERLSREFKIERNSELKQYILQDEFWDETEKVANLLHPLSTSIQFCEGDGVPLSAVPVIWAYIENQLNEENLMQAGWNIEEIHIILENVASRKKMSIQPVTLAAYLLDPRFHEQQNQLSDNDWQTASNFIINFAESLNIDRISALNELTDYRAKSGAFGIAIIWEAVLSPTCAESPLRWWIAYGRKSQLSQVAEMILSFPCTAAMVERCNKSYSVQKTKIRNRLLPQRASKLAIVSFNLRIERELNEPSKKSLKRAARNNIVTLLTLPTIESKLQKTKHVDNNMNNTISSNNDTNNEIGSANKFISDDDSDYSYVETEEYEADEVRPSTSMSKFGNKLITSDSSSTSDSDTDIHESDELPAMRVSLVPGDWVAVRVYCQNKPNVTKSKILVREIENMYIARVKDAKSESLYTVLFLKRKSDGSYCWPDKDDIITVHAVDMVKMSSPEEKIISQASRVRDLRVKYIFSRNDIEKARKTLKIAIGNVC